MFSRAKSGGSGATAARPFFSKAPPSATSFFSAPRGVQAKLTIGAPGDRFEREADAVADGVVQRMESGSGVSAERSVSAPTLQTKCSECEREDTVRRQVADSARSGAHAQVSESVHQALSSQRGGGRSLDATLQREMEHEIGADFSAVRIHTGGPATSLNQSLHARAFTHGQDVFFGAGQFQPDTRAGRHLLAHELTHVVQQSGSTPQIQRDDAGGGSTEFTDSVSSTVRSSASPLITGTVTRTETAPASGSAPREVIHTGRMNVEFDPSTCSITIPFGYSFVQALPADAGPCNAGPAPTLLSTAAFNALKANVLRVVNSGLNGWFDVELTGSGCPEGCSGRLLPIRVVATENNSNPDRTITIVNRAGRSDAGTICALSWSDTTARHEGGHQILGLGDEYEETDETLRTVVPEWFRNERVRTDYSAMGPGMHSRFAMFHARHFAAVTTFLSHIFPGCTATLRERARPIIPDFRISLSGGYAALSGEHGYFLRAGVDLGIPLDRLRTWELTLGPEFQLLAASTDEGSLQAFLLGARLGLEGSTGGIGFGVSGGPFLSAGYGWFNSTVGPGFGSRDASGAYGEVGARFGIRSGLSDSVRLNFGLEGAAGSALGAPGIVGPVPPDIESDPARTHWFRVGLGAGLQF